MDDIQKLVGQFEERRSANHRYASFDYCFNYFRNFNEQGRLSELKSEDNMQMSCLQIGFFLASWGMFRGKSHLGQEANVSHFMELVEEVSSWHGAHELVRIWKTDVDDYDKPETCDLLNKCYAKIQGKLVCTSSQESRVLVTKAMLGIFGCVPAFDKYFSGVFGNLSSKNGRAFNCDALTNIVEFYKKHFEIINGLAEATKSFDFQTREKTGRCYTKAKIIDMIGFQKGKNNADAKKADERKPPVSFAPQTAPTPTPDKAHKDRKPGLGKLGGFLGSSVVAVIRTMGAEGWEFWEVKKVLTDNNISAAENTIRIQLSAGRKGEKEGAPISEKLKELRPDPSENRKN